MYLFSLADSHIPEVTAADLSAMTLFSGRAWSEVLSELSKKKRITRLVTASPSLPLCFESVL